MILSGRVKYSIIYDEKAREYFNKELTINNLKSIFEYAKNINTESYFSKFVDEFWTTYSGSKNK